MTEIALEEARSKLAELIANLKSVDEVEITQGNRTAAKLIGPKPQRVFGLGKGKLTIVKEDQEHSEDFKDYMP